MSALSFTLEEHNIDFTVNTDSHLEAVLEKRNEMNAEELQELERMGKVKEALNSKLCWTKLAANMSEKRFRMNKRVSKGLDSSSSHGDKLTKSSFVGWDGLKNVPKLVANQLTELSELKDRHIVQKSLQHPQEACETARKLFRPKIPPNTRIHIKKRGGNVLVTDCQTEKDDNIQNRVRQRSQALVETIFSIPSRSKRVLERLTTVQLDSIARAEQIRVQQVRSNADLMFTSSSHSPNHSSNGGSSLSENTKPVSIHKKRSLFRGRKPYIKKSASFDSQEIETTHDDSKHIPFGALRMKKQHFSKSMQIPHSLLLDSLDDTIEELSEVESVSSTGTVQDAPLIVQDSKFHPQSPLNNVIHTAGSSDVQATKIQTVQLDGEEEENPETYEKVINEEERLREVKVEERKIQSSKCEKLSESFQMTSQHVNKGDNHHESIGSEVSIPISQNDTKLLNYSRSISSSSVTSSYLSQSSHSSMTFGSIEDNEDDDNNEECEEEEEEREENEIDDQKDKYKYESEDDIPMIPSMHTNHHIVNEQSTWSWLDSYQSRFIRDTSQESAESTSSNSYCYLRHSVTSPEISDSPFNTPAYDPLSPSFTPVIRNRSNTHPLSQDFDPSELNIRHKQTRTDSSGSENPRQKPHKGSIPEEAWDDPNFLEYCRILNHKPTLDDFVSYKILMLSETIEEQFGSKLEKAFQEAIFYALKDQLSYIAFTKVTHSLAKQSDYLQEQAFLITCLGRRLWEKLPDLQDKIQTFTAKAVEEITANFFMQLGLSRDAPPVGPETRWDYDDWSDMFDKNERTDHEEILTENLVVHPEVVDTCNMFPSPRRVSSEEALGPSVSENHLPTHEMEVNSSMLMVPLNRLWKSRSVEVLFTEKTDFENLSDSHEIENEDSPENSTIVSESPRKDSMPVFDTPVTLPGSHDTDDVIKVETSREVIEHLERFEQNEEGSIKKPIVLSTSSVDTESCISGTYPSRGSIGSTSSSKSISSMSDVFPNTSIEGVSKMDSVRRMSGLNPPLWEEENENEENNDVCTHSEIIETSYRSETRQNQYNSDLEYTEESEMHFTHITMIKQTKTHDQSHDRRHTSSSIPSEDQRRASSSSSSHDRTHTSSTSSTDDIERPGTERRRSSAQMVADMVLPTIPALSIVVPLAVLTAISISKS